MGRIIRLDANAGQLEIICRDQFIDCPEEQIKTDINSISRNDVLRGLVVKVDGSKGAVVRLFNNIHGLIPVRRLVREQKDIDTALEQMGVNSVIDVKVNKIEVDNNRLELKFHDEAEVAGLPSLFSVVNLELAYKLSRYNSWVCVSKGTGLLNSKDIE